MDLRAHELHRRLLELIGVLGCAALVAGLVARPEALAFDPLGAFVGIVDTLPITGPAAVLVLAAAGANLLAGAVLVTVLRRRPFTSLVDLALWGFAGAVLFDLHLVYALGAIDLFRLPVVLAAHGLIVGLAYWRRVPILGRPTGARAGDRLPGWFVAFVVLAWSPPVLLQLASPVSPFMDVLPNHTAPVEHLRTFGSFDPLTTNPSPIYGPSRTSLGFVAVLGTMATVTGLTAALTVSAFVVVEVILVAAAAYRLGATFGGRWVAPWMLMTFALTHTFARLADDRSRVLVFPIAVVALVSIVETVRRSRERAGMEAWRSFLIPGLALGATILFHAVIGAFVAATVIVLALLDRRARIGDAVAIVAVGGTLALPQAAIMVGVDLPAAAGLLALPAALGVARLLAEPVVARAIAVATVGFGGVALVAAVVVLPVPHAARDWVGSYVDDVPILLATILIGLVFARARLPLVVWAGALVGAAAAIVTVALPDGAGVLLLDALGYEMPKEVKSWLPVMLAVGAATALARFSAHVASWRVDRATQSASFAVLAGFVVLATLPLRFEPIDPLYDGEQRLSETMAIQLRHAERGFFTGYPDSRQVVNAEQAQVLNAIRERIADGRIGADTQLLHVARTFRHWESLPIGTFTGVRTTTVSEDGGVTIHTVGGRLRTPDRLEELLASRKPTFAYLVLEPDTPDRERVRELILDAGFRPAFENREGELFTRQPGG